MPSFGFRDSGIDAGQWRAQELLPDCRIEEASSAAVRPEVTIPMGRAVLPFPIDATPVESVKASRGRHPRSRAPPGALRRP